MKKSTLVLCCFLFLGCANEEGTPTKNEGTPAKNKDCAGNIVTGNETSTLICSSPDSRLTGEWVQHLRGEWLSSIAEYTYYDYYSLTFNNTNQYTKYVSRQKYGVKQYCNTRELKTGCFYGHEWKIESGKFHERLWNNKYSDWESVAYTINGQSLIFHRPFKGRILDVEYRKE